MENLIAIGYIVGTFGTSGYVKIKPLTSWPERFYSTKRVFFEKEEDIYPLIIEKVELQNDRVVIKFKGIDEIKEALKLIGGYIKIPKSELKPLENNEYYIFQLKGLQVIDLENKTIGQVKTVLQNPANDLLVVVTQENEEILIPFLKIFIKEVNLESGIIKVQLLPGMLEE